MTKNDLQVIDYVISILNGRNPGTIASALSLLEGLRIKAVNSLSVIKETEAQRFVRVFGEVYRACAGFPYKTSAKTFILATKLIKDHGFDEVQDKMELLAFHCRDGKLWFVREGWADFTIETLSNRWNNILPQRRLSPEEQKNLNYQAELKKWEAHDEAINQAIIRAGEKSNNHGVGTAPCAAR